MNNSISQKNVLSRAVALAIGLSASGVVLADPVASFELRDFDSDGLSSDFGFALAPPGNGGNAFGATGETGCINSTGGNVCDPIDMLAGPRTPVANNGGVNFFQVLEFTTGFNFGGGGDFNPNIAGDINATIDPVLANAGDGQALQFGALDFGGVYQAAVAPPGNQFFLGPDHLQNCTGAPPGATGGICGATAASDSPALSNPVGYNVETITNLGGGTYGVVARYVGTITGTGTSFDGNQANWRFEGVMTLQDVAPVVTLNGVNPLIVAPDTNPFVDPGATCFDGVDGSITSPGPGVPSFVITDNNAFAPSVGPSGNSFTITYTCTDSANQQTVVTRAVSSGSDSVPPVITLTAADPVNSIPDRLDTVDGTAVRILQNVTYTDLGASCIDNTGAIPFPTTGPAPLQFTVDSDTVDTSLIGATNITFTCNDLAGNGPVQAVRTVTVEADSVKPVIALPAGDETITVSPLGSSIPASTVTCADSNQFGTVIDIPLGTVGQPGFTVSPDPATIDTNVAADTTLTYTCVDAAGNNASPVQQVIRVADAQTFQILSMTISDVDADGVAGCFRFESLQTDPSLPGLCDLANRFSSDGSVTGFPDESNKTLPGTGTDLENGSPVGIRFGTFQPINLMTPGFNFSNFPFVPFTFDPPSKSANPPSGFVNVIDAQAGVALLDIRDFPFSGLYDSNTPNEFILDPDPGTLSTRIFQINNDDNGVTRTFHYDMSWSHRIGPGANPPSPCPEDPTGSFCGNNAFFRLEGVVTVNSVPVVLNNPPIIDSVIAAQSALSKTRIVVATDGAVTVTAVASDPDGDTLSYDWSRSDSRLTPTGGGTNSTFVFDPAGLAPGFYPLVIDVTDDAVEPLTASSELLLEIVSSAPELGTGDTNGNGISDIDEGFGDSDDDGISDYQDAIDGTINPTRNLRDVSDPGAGEVVSSDGRLRLANTAFKTGRGSFIVTEGEVGVIDRVNLVDGLGHSGGGIYDFEVVGLASGAAVQVVLPQAAPLPVQPVYRKFSSATGWGVFSTTGQNALASTRRVNGVCPGPASTLYDNSLGLVQGDDCIRLTIVDGGPNDGDTTRNGSVLDPGTAAGDGPVPVGDTANSIFSDAGGGCSIGRLTRPGAVAATRADWWLVAIFLAGLGFIRQKHKSGSGKSWSSSPLTG